MSTNKEFCL